MTDSYWVRDLLQEEWDRSTDPIAGEGDIRERLTSTPKFEIGGDADRRARQADTQPAIFISDGGEPTRDAQGIGYRSERVESEVSVEIVVSGDRIDFVGRVENDYGGVKGEFKRILDKHRKGFDGPVASLGNPGYDIILYDRFDDESDRRGGGIWTGEWTVRFINFAKKIKQ